MAAYEVLGDYPLDIDRYPVVNHDANNWRKSSAQQTPSKLAGVRGRVQENRENTDQYQEYAITHGLSVMGSKIIKSNVPLKTRTLDGNQPPDVLNYKGRRFEVVSMSDNRDTVLPHCTATALEIQSTQGGRA